MQLGRPIECKLVDDVGSRRRTTSVIIVNAIGHQHMCHMTDIASHPKINNELEQCVKSCATQAALTVTHTGSPLSLCLLLSVL